MKLKTARRHTLRGEAAFTMCQHADAGLAAEALCEKVRAAMDGVRQQNGATGWAEAVAYHNWMIREGYAPAHLPLCPTGRRRTSSSIEEADEKVVDSIMQELDAKPKSTSFTLGEHFTDFIEAQVSSGRYGSASDVVRAGLRLLEENEAKREALVAALTEGEQSGLSTEFDIEAFITRKRRGRSAA